MMLHVNFILVLIICILIYRICLYKTEFSWEGKLFLAISMCLLSEIYIAFFLAFVGKYSLINVCAITLFISGIIFFTVNAKMRISLADAIVDLKPHKKDINYAFFIVFAILFFLYFLFPVYYMWGRRDPNVYFLMGTNIARNGTLSMPSNDLIDQMYEEIKDFADLSFRGFYPKYMYITNWNGNYSAIQAQFLHVFSSALSIGYSLAGIEGMVRVPAVISAMAIWAIYNFVSFFAGKKYGTFAAFLMGVCPAQIWGARITQTEVLCQWIYILVAFLFAYTVKKSKNGFVLVLVGISLGLANLIRIDACLLGLGLLLCVCALNVYRKQEANWNLLAYGYIVTTLFSFFINFKSSSVYLYKHQSYVYPVLAVCMLLFLLNIWVRRSKLIVKFCGWTFRISNIFKSEKKNLLQITFIIAIVLFKYLWFIRPLNQNGSTQSYDFWQRCFVELFNYIPLIFYPLFFLGLLYIYLEKERFKGIELFAVIGLVTTCVYLYKPTIAPDHIWASRRWETSVFPFITIIAVLGIYMLEEHLKKKRVWGTIVSYGLILYSACFMLHQSSSFLFQPMLKDMVDQYEQLAANMDDDELYFVEMSHFGAYLRFLYDKNAVVINLENEEAFWNYVNNNDEKVFFIGDINTLKYSYNYAMIYEGEIKGTYIKQAMYGLTGKLTETGTTTNIYVLTAEE